MSDEQREREAIAVELARDFYQVLAKYLPHTATLGELQVLTEVAMGMYRDTPISVSEIGETTGLNRWSVSRIVMRYIELGMIVERKDPRDSRRNLLVWTDDAFKDNRTWSADWLRVWQAGVDRMTG